eukprot:TRINITY_DN6054_c0_g1_i1.p1 TRINITY_DN6054_c0_g1~~TRINITY_DN6054_c0_g1_i1.p1  ORF type:complete len:349 (+),score=82.78 TRINITY_DN6054_c0_g1_i1:690-1736(+)
MMVFLGIVIVYCMGFGLLYSDDFYKVIVYTGIGLACLNAVLISVSPKSPRHLLYKNHQTEARDSLVFYRPVRWDVDEELREMKSHMVIEAPDQGCCSSFFTNFRAIVILLVGIIFGILEQLAGISLVYSLVSILLEIEESSFYGITASASVAGLQFIVTAMFSGSFDRWGRRPVLLITLLLQGVGALLVFVVEDDVSVAVRMVFLGIYVVSFAAGPGPIVWFVGPELFPQNVRACGYSLALFCNWIAGYIVVISSSKLQTDLGLTGMFELFAVITFATLVFVYFLLPETGKLSLEKVEEKLMRSPGFCSIFPETIFSRLCCCCGARRSGVASASENSTSVELEAQNAS